MLRLPPSTIDLTRRDIDWHCARSRYRTQCSEQRATLRFATSESLRRGLHDTSINPQPDSQQPHENESSLPRLKRPQDVEATWEDMLIRRQRATFDVPSSPQLPQLRYGDDSSWDLESLYYSSPSLYESDSSGRLTPTSVEPNIQPSEHSTIHRTISDPQIDGVYETQTASHNPVRLASPHPRSSFIDLGQPELQAAPLRTRNLSTSIPEFHLPLRLAESAQHSSSSNQVRNSRAHGPSREQGNTQRSNPNITDLSTLSLLQEDGPMQPELAGLDAQSSSTHRRLERFSPTSNTRISLLRTSGEPWVGASTSQAISANNLSSLGSSATVYHSYSFSATNSASEASATSERYQDNHSRQICGSFNSAQFLRTANSEFPPRQSSRGQLPVYNDGLSPGLQPQTLVDISRRVVRPQLSWGLSTALPTQHTNISLLSLPPATMQPLDASSSSPARVTRDQHEQEIGDSDIEFRQRRVEIQSEDGLNPIRSLDLLGTKPPRHNFRPERDD